MTRAEILDSLSGVFAEVFGRPVMLTEATTSADVDGWDSIAHVMLIVASEGEFGVRFDSTELANVATVGEFVSLIAAKRNGAS